MPAAHVILALSVMLPYKVLLAADSVPVNPVNVKFLMLPVIATISVPPDTSNDGATDSLYVPDVTVLVPDAPV